MSGYAFLIQLAVWGGLLLSLLWGSILALRGAKNWCTLLLVIGASTLLAGTVALISVGMLAFNSAMGTGSSGIAWGILAAVGGILLLVGIILFCAGFVGLGAKYGATAKRAEELEGLVVQPQQHIQGM